MLTKQSQFIVLVDNDRLKKADAIILLEGDGFFRIDKAFELYQQKWAPVVVISGGIVNRSYGSFPPRELKERLIKAGVPKSKIVLDNASQNTKEQAVNIIKLTKKKDWQRIILVASNYHQYRAYATFVKAMLKANTKIEIINAPASLPWFKKERWGKRIELLTSELEKFDRYIKDGHIATFEEIFHYQVWKEKQS